MGCCTLRWLGKTHFSRLDLVSIFCYPLEKQRAFPFLYALFCSKSVSVRFTTVARLGANSGLTCHNWLASATNMLPFLGFFFFLVCVCVLFGSFVVVCNIFALELCEESPACPYSDCTWAQPAVVHIGWQSYTVCLLLLLALTLPLSLLLYLL